MAGLASGPSSYGRHRVHRTEPDGLVDDHDAIRKVRGRGLGAGEGDPEPAFVLMTAAAVHPALAGLEGVPRTNIDEFHSVAGVQQVEVQGDVRVNLRDERLVGHVLSPNVVHTKDPRSLFSPRLQLSRVASVS